MLVLACETWTVAKAGTWLPWPPPGLNNLKAPPPSSLRCCRSFTPSRQSLTATPSPDRLEARSEVCSALSLKPKQDYLFNFPNTLMKTKFQPKDTSLDPNSSLTIASFPRPPLE